MLLESFSVTNLISRKCNLTNKNALALHMCSQRPKAGLKIIIIKKNASIIKASMLDARLNLKPVNIRLYF